MFFNCSTVVGEEGKESTSFLSGVGHFFTMFIGSALIGIAFALLSALVSLRNLTIQYIITIFRDKKHMHRPL